MRGLDKPGERAGRIGIFAATHATREVGFAARFHGQLHGAGFMASGMSEVCPDLETIQEKVTELTLAHMLAWDADEDAAGALAASINGNAHAYVDLIDEEKKKS